MRKGAYLTNGRLPRRGWSGEDQKRKDETHLMLLSRSNESGKGGVSQFRMDRWCARCLIDGPVWFSREACSGCNVCREECFGLLRRVYEIPICDLKRPGGSAGQKV